MKKILFLSSLVLLTAWIAGAFMMHGSLVVHTLLVLALITYIRSLMIIDPNPSAYNQHSFFNKNSTR